MASKDLKVTLIGVDDTKRAFGSAEKNATGFGGKIGKVGKLMATAFGGAAVAGVAGFGAALFQGAKDAASYQQITDQLAQTLKSTGGAAGVSVEGLKQYAGQLESISGVDEELILSSQNVLATFTNLKDGVGAGNKIFSQASQAALNLSTTMGGDLQGATVMVGKALNDPIKGISALSKAGVQLTADQKALIKEMVATGDVAGAQKIILGELEVQFGGAAAAAGQGLTGSLARAKDAFSDIFREVAERALPKLAEFAEWAAVQLPIAFGVASTFISTHVVPAFRAIGDFWAVNGPTITTAIQTMGAAIVSAFTTAGQAVMATVNFFREHDTAAKALGVVVGAVSAAVVAAWAVQGVAATVGAVKQVGAWMTVATTGMLAGEAQKKTTAQIVAGWAVQAAKATAHAAVVVAGWVATGAAAAASVARQVASWVLLGAQSLAAAAKVAAAWLISMGPIALVIAAVVGLVAVVVKNWNTISAKTAELWTKVKTLTSAAWTAVKQLVASGIADVVALVTGLKEKVTGAVSGAGTWLSEAGRKVIDGFISSISDGFRKVKETLGKLTDLLPDWKGPATKDAKLLYGAGQLVMGGFERGLRDSFGDVRRTLSDATDLVGMKAAGPGFVQSRLAASAASAPVEPRLAGGSRTEALLQELLDELRGVHGTARAMPRNMQALARQNPDRG